MISITFLIFLITQSSYTYIDKEFKYYVENNGIINYLSGKRLTIKCIRTEEPFNITNQIETSIYPLNRDYFQQQIPIKWFIATNPLDFHLKNIQWIPVDSNYLHIHDDISTSLYFDSVRVYNSGIYRCGHVDRPESMIFLKIRNPLTFIHHQLEQHHNQSIPTLIIQRNHSVQINCETNYLEDTKIEIILVDLLHQPVKMDHLNIYKHTDYLWSISFNSMMTIRVICRAKNLYDFIESVIMQISSNSAHNEEFSSLEITPPLENPTYLHEGDNFNINCVIEYMDLISVRWEFIKLDQINVSDSMILTQSINSINNINGLLYKETIYNIRNFSTDQVGIYVCRVFSDHIVYSFFLSVTIQMIEPKIPEILSIKGSRHVKDGQPISLSCLSSGSPNPKISWVNALGIKMRECAAASHDHGSCDLEIKKANFSEHNGYLKCLAENIRGKDEINIEFIVIIDIDVKSNKEINNNIIYMNYNDYEFLDCSIGLSNPKPIIQWYKQITSCSNHDNCFPIEYLWVNIPFSSINNRHSVQILPSFANFFYKCSVFNQFNRTDIVFKVFRLGIKTKELVILPPNYDPNNLNMFFDQNLSMKSYAIDESKTLNISCIFFNQTLKKLKWNFKSSMSNQNNLEEMSFNIRQLNGGYLQLAYVEISMAKLNHSGTYWCSGYSLIKNQSIETNKINITVKELKRPFIHNTMKTFILEDTTLNGSYGAILICNVTGYPLPNLRWFFKPFFAPNRDALNAFTPINECVYTQSNYDLNVICKSLTNGYYCDSNFNNRLILCWPSWNLNSGFVKCQADNIIGSASDKFNISIISRPKITSPSMISIDFFDLIKISKVENTSVLHNLIECSAIGNPVPKVLWNLAPISSAVTNSVSFNVFCSKSPLNHISLPIGRKNDNKISTPISINYKSDNITCIGQQYMDIKAVRNLLSLENPSKVVLECIAFNNFGLVSHNLTIINEKLRAKTVISNQRNIIVYGIIGTIITCFVVMIIIVSWYRRRLHTLKLKYLRNNKEFKVDITRSLFEQTGLMPYDPDWEFPRDKLNFIKVLGSGAFGQVWLVEAHGIDLLDPTNKSKEAVKKRKIIRKTPVNNFSFNNNPNINGNKNNLIKNSSLYGKFYKNLSSYFTSNFNFSSNFTGAFENTAHQKSYSHYSKNVYSEQASLFDRNIVIKSLKSLNVAVKTLKDDAGENEFKDLASEIKILIYIGQHKNIVNILGASTIGGPKELCLIEEFCEKGSLLSFLRSNRNKIIWNTASPTQFRISNHSNGLSDSIIHNQHTMNIEETFEITDDGGLKSTDLINFCCQISAGMSYLSSKHCVHRDLAARNILITSDLILKIGDFGLARNIDVNDCYLKKTAGLLPIKWMAPESLLYKTFTTGSDVWSFGVVIWEIFSLGSSPYVGINGDQLLNFLETGKRLDRPEKCPTSLYELAMMCWEFEAKNRPSFIELQCKLINLNLSNGLSVSKSSKAQQPDDTYLEPTNNPLNDPKPLTFLNSMDISVNAPNNDQKIELCKSKWTNIARNISQSLNKYLKAHDREPSTITSTIYNSNNPFI